MCRQRNIIVCSSQVFGHRLVRVLVSGRIAVFLPTNCLANDSDVGEVT